ncbi:hypothetical protein [Paraburkholderia terrae]|uniref:hypothetical protein n=1 Tax=Paraburkholderia terrae TaxID=311230 RepID=UPI001EE3073E|nr:hypothetical protein [Paraburkholderia terrae]GJH02547.1 hypothetical protein CBA19C8_18340 [Paraburkholderia terrae]
MMGNIPRKADAVRASRDGHEYHEAWAARKAMQLLLPDDGLVGIAVEGLEAGDQAAARAEVVEIADLTLYFGNAPGFEHSHTVAIVQFKYSPARASTDFRASDAKKTVRKFAVAFEDFISRYGFEKAEAKLRFELLTNRPIYPPLAKAIDGLAKGTRLSGEAKNQAAQLKAAAALDGRTLSSFLKRLVVVGSRGSLVATKSDLSMLLADWSASTDLRAVALVGAIRDMVRNKAGYIGTDRNVIRDTDVLAALQIPDRDALLPCPSSLTTVSDIVPRAQLESAAALIPTLKIPMLVHAAGGVGKTVFMESLAKTLEVRFETIFFDCFGGGAYRSPEDARHLPKHGLVHIANSLACRGLCDPVIPGADDLQSLLKTFRRRLEQSVSTLATVAPQKELLIFIDAIDNAAEHARDVHEDCFPVRFLESLQQTPVAGVKVVVSSRSHRIPIAHLSYCDFELRPFGPAETATYLHARMPKVTELEIRVAQARSDGNPRVLAYLVSGGSGLLDASDIDSKIELTDLIQQRLDSALAGAISRGYKSSDASAFLAGLSVLPPPVPLEEYAAAHGLHLSEIESFVADLWPLLERTRHGLMFRDEPTETLVREKYGSLMEPLRKVAANLLASQEHSVYSARALPGLLQKLGDGQQLFALAFDERFPSTITSTVGRRNIRYARLQAAIRYAADRVDFDQLVRLLVELSTVAAVNRRGADYILAAPDLVVAAADVDATRRLFETRTSWPGARHARLAIANTLVGDLDEASRHAIRTDDWLRHEWQQDESNGFRREGPRIIDHAAIPLYLIARGKHDEARRYMGSWKAPYAFEIGKYLFSLVRQRDVATGSNAMMRAFLSGLTKEAGCMAAALSFVELAPATRKELVAALARMCARAKFDIKPEYGRDTGYRLDDGLRKASAIAASYGMRREAVAIARRATYKRPDLWSFRDHFGGSFVFPFLFDVSLTAALKGYDLREKDVVPAELMTFCRGMKSGLSGADFRGELKKRLEKRWQARDSDTDSSGKTFSYETKREAEEYLDERLGPMLELANALVAVLKATVGRADKPYLALLSTWTDVERRGDRYGLQKRSPFFERLARQTAMFALWARSDLKLASVRAFCARLREQQFLTTGEAIGIIAILAKRKPLQMLAGEEALRVRAMIEAESDVTSRASLHAQLARAILPASQDEAVAYFRIGLEQMDAIGSGDYEFVNELLIFASSIRGDEMDGHDVHTLTNICELNLSDEPEKFTWYAFGKAMSRISGCRELAKLGRWDDRAKAPLRYTLLPYLTALVEDGKIGSDEALFLNRLAGPAELYVCGTDAFAKSIAAPSRTKEAPVVREMIDQFYENNPGCLMAETVETLAAVSRQVLGAKADITRRLEQAFPLIVRTRDVRNAQMNYHGRKGRSVATVERPRHGAGLAHISRKANPLDEQSMQVAVASVQALGDFYLSRGQFFDQIRKKVPLGDMAAYLQVLLRLENLDLYSKLEEFERCKILWAASSSAIQRSFAALAIPLLHIHCEDMITGGRLAGYLLKQISDLCGVPIATLAIELVKVFAGPEADVEASAWLSLASFLCEQAQAGAGQAALKRLLNSDAAKLSSAGADGDWNWRLDPTDASVEVVAGLTWRMLGSPYAADRWQAAHSMRRMARFGRWDLVAAIVAQIDREDAAPFQAPELPFYYLHARLWLLIALARISIDSPQALVGHSDVLLSVVTGRFGPHVLMREFASRALVNCMDRGGLTVAPDIEQQLRGANSSAMPRLTRKRRSANDFYQTRPKDAPKQKLEFRLDYDFHKYDVQSLARVFDLPGWKVEDRISEIARRIDPKVLSMWDRGGRSPMSSYRSSGMSSSEHTYGEQIGWHALQLAAGELLAKFPVMEAEAWSAGDDPWLDWIRRYDLTRRDGLWLSDGVDDVPLDLNGILLEEGDDGLMLTGNKDTLLSLVGLPRSGDGDITVSGYWKSADGVDVRISSVLAPRGEAGRLAKKLIAEQPVLAWLPECGEGDDGDNDYERSEHPHCIPWIVTPSGETRLDADDPLASVAAARRPRIAKRFRDAERLHCCDAFNREWRNSRGRVLARADAWGRDDKRGETGASGVRLRCSTRLLSNVLARNNADLVLLVTLKRYIEGAGAHADSRRFDTVAVVRITQTMAVSFYKGRVNHLYQSQH